MTPDRSIEDRIATWLFDEAPERLPERVLQRTFRRTELLRQRRSRGRRDLRMPHATRLVAIGGAAIAIAFAAGSALLPRPAPSVSGGPSGSPAPSAGGSAAASGAPTTPLALGGDIAFTRTIDGNTDIYL